jgi:hypothetical protein
MSLINFHRIHAYIRIRRSLGYIQLKYIYIGILHAEIHVERRVVIVVQRADAALLVIRRTAAALPAVVVIVVEDDDAPLMADRDILPLVRGFL